ncbi:MAG: flagellar biosynthetic protein FliO [Thermaurantiacus tibetensis]|uniref:flagellar biosynthetic protein FliO n=1 Tax=Thermaurantiacus tibetensis TaxID=2759035 RepID=UPI00188DDFB9|nr:flagellar biosynthetic protein FliO [Thermaurantiacus tibetensis]
MIADFLLRLLVALPLVLGLAVGALLLMRRGWLPLPAELAARWRAAGAGRGGASAEPCGSRLDIVASRMLQPGVRVVLLRHAGRDHLLAVSPQGVTVLGSEPAPTEAVAEPLLRPVRSGAAA